MSETKSTAPEEQPKVQPGKRSRRWRFFRFMVVGFVGLVTLFVLFHAVENWRGKRAWNQYRQEMESKGAMFTYDSLIPPAIPDAQNFAMTPLLKPVMEFNPLGVEPRWKDTNGYNRAREVSGLQLQPDEANAVNATGSPEWRLGERFDLKRWQEAFRTSTNFPSRPQPDTPAEDVLYALERHAEPLAELRRASVERPNARYDIRYEQEDKAGILLPHLGIVKGLTRVYKLRALAYLAAGKPDEAFTDVNVMLRLSESVSHEPTLISHLVRLACFEITVNTIWEGLVTHQWKPEHLEHWQSKLAAYDFLKESYEGLKGERAFGNEVIAFLRKYPHHLDQIGEITVSSPSEAQGAQFGYRLVPKGWFYFEQVNYNRLFDEFILAPSARNKGEVELKQLKASRKDLDQVFANRDPLNSLLEHRALVNLLIPAVERVTQKGFYAQSTIDQALIALALERHYLEHKTYPATLEELVPKYASALPLDLCVQKPFRYERLNATSFRLWSVGWNQKDDNGGVVKKNSTTLNIDEGDWVWPQVTDPGSKSAE